MACNIVQGREILCRDASGGTVEVYLTEFDNVPQSNITASSGVITAATCSAGKRFFTYKLEKENAQFDQKLISSVENGSTYVEMTLTLSLNGMSASLRNHILTAAYNRLHIIVKDAQLTPVYHWMGQTGGADLTNADGSTGKAMGDKNGFMLTFTAKEPVLANTVSAAIVASLQIGS